ncbi:MAG TPA: hypothetical protein PKA64_12405, partial [Myxococcota bacterium]|nr:hypothetical protein [Myxococcota bacterium]
MPELALLIAGAYVAMALIMLRRPAATPDGPDAPIVILRPCEGREPDLRLDPDGPGYATILCTADPASPA